VSAKQDRQGARTAADLERKYNFGKTFAEIMGIATDARESVVAVEAEMSERYTTMMRDTESIIMSALESYVETSDYEELRQTISTQLEVMSSEILMTFTTVTDKIDTVEDGTRSEFETLYQYISAAGGRLTFSDSVTTRQLALDNGVIQFINNGDVRGSWDGDNFYTGNIVIKVSERAQYGNFAYIPRSDKSLMFLKVGDT
jgi:hypothetical protein